MSKAYYTYRIRILDENWVRVEVRDPQDELMAEPSGAFGYRDVLREQIDRLNEAAQKKELRGANVKVFGEALFNALFDTVLRQNFVDLYHKAVRGEGNLLRIELDINEQAMPAVAALPWEFMRVPRDANLGTLWLGTEPNLIFSRRRAQWHVAPPIQLAQNERLRIALAVAAPTDEGQVAYEEVQAALERLAQKQATRIELLPVVEQANPETIDEILRQKPHIFHFIGHGRLKRSLPVGEIALVDDFDEAMWVDAEYFSELFNEHQPGVVMLQACEGGTLSASDAFVGVASRIVQQNIPVVVAMQYAISNSTAKRFALRFYQRLAEENPVDQAAQNGRRGIALGPTQYKARDFATPVIFMRVRNGHLFEREEGEPASAAASSQVSTATSPQVPTSTSYYANVTNGVNQQGTGGTAVGAGGIYVGGNVGGNVIAAPQPFSSSSPVLPASLPATLSFKQKGELIKALLACPTISNRQSRNTVLNELPLNIKNNIARSPNNHVDVTNLVNTCLNYPHGLQELLEIVRYFERGSLRMQEVERVVAGF